jgi:hypothetical protein
LVRVRVKVRFRVRFRSRVRVTVSQVMLKSCHESPFRCHHLKDITIIRVRLRVRVRVTVRVRVRDRVRVRVREYSYTNPHLKDITIAFPHQGLIAKEMQNHLGIYGQQHLV